jgi:hypothetical protein
VPYETPRFSLFDNIIYNIIGIVNNIICESATDILSLYDVAESTLVMSMSRKSSMNASNADAARCCNFALLLKLGFSPLKFTVYPAFVHQPIMKNWKTSITENNQNVA